MSTGSGLAAALVVLVALAVALAGVGLLGLRHRDIDAA
jgi:ABC-2 type transport system permease protein